jgi:hypothetical protein
MKTLAVACLLALTTPAVGGEEPAHVVGVPPALGLSPPLRTALVQEMQAVDRNLQRIVASIPRADWPTVQSAAEEIRASFILEKQLSEEQRHELERSLPVPFREMDERFHRTAAKLATAAKASDADLVTFYAYRLAELCVAWHRSYAPSRFPGFRETEVAPHAH